MKRIDEALNSVTMYRLVVYGLGILAGLGILFAFIGRLSFSPVDMVLSLIALLASAYVVERVLGYIWKTPSNSESWLITGLILFLILQPAHDLATGLTLLLAGSLASATKFLIAWNGKHILNPAAAAAVLVSLFGLQPAAWWIGSSIFWPFTAVIGLVVVAKIRRFPLAITFFIVSIGLQLLLFAVDGQLLATSVQQALIASPLIFLGTIMLTEPATMPARRDQQVIFAVIVAILYITAWKIGPVYIYPEVALVLGNIYAFIVSPKFKVQLWLKEIEQISENIYSYVFQPDRKINFIAGQYMEWTLADVPFDSRGNRRTFTIASSPTEEKIRVGLKYYEPSSAYKQTFKSLQVGDSIYASQLAGNFTLDGHENRKLAFIAGGIGITPFRSMITYLTDTQTHTDIVLVYMVSDEKEFAYVNEFKRAAALGVRLVLISSQATATRPGVMSTALDAETLSTIIPDYQERLFYISGPNNMVIATKQQLRSLHVQRKHIKTDYFSGY